MSPTPTPTPSPLDGLHGADSTSPSLDSVLTDIAANNDPNAPYGANPNAALDSVSRTVFGVDYIPDTGLVVTVSPLAILVTFAAAVIVGGVLVARRARRSGEPSRARFTAQRLAERDRERERAARERDTAARLAVKAAEAAASAEAAVEATQLTAPRDPFEVMDEARDRAIGWAVAAFLGWLIGTVILTMGDNKSLAVVLIASSISSVTIPALVMAGRELARRSRAKRATTVGGVR